jgi:hypothetical protein
MRLITIILLNHRINISNKLSNNLWKSLEIYIQTMLILKNQVLILPDKEIPKKQSILIYSYESLSSDRFIFILVLFLSERRISWIRKFSINGSLSEYFMVTDMTRLISLY